MRTIEERNNRMLEIAYEMKHLCKDCTTCIMATDDCCRVKGYSPFMWELPTRKIEGDDHPKTEKI